MESLESRQPLMLSEKMWEKPGEECGVYGVFQPNSTHLGQDVYIGLLGLQHRGQDAAGIAVFTSDGPVVESGLGLVEDAIQNNAHTIDGLDRLRKTAIGHVRYSTVNVDNPFESIQPLIGRHFALTHNGHIENMGEVANTHGLSEEEYSSDSDALTKLLDRIAQDTDLDQALDTLLPQLEGAYSLVISDGQRLIGIRDPHGIRPLSIGRLNDTGQPGYVLSSEDSALQRGVIETRDIEPGEIIEVSDDGVKSRFISKERSLKICAFEYVYFARPESTVQGRNVYSAREETGRILAAEHPVEADVVIGLPETGMHSAFGYSEASGIPLKPGVSKNPYTGRTFISSSEINKEDAIRLKLRPVRDILANKRVIVCDDSIVRGNTMRTMVSSFRESGAKEIHLRIASPPYMWPCFYGMDTANKEQLFAANLSKEEMRQYLGADSLEFVSHEGLVQAISLPLGSLCMACTTGDYPTELPERVTSQLFPIH